MTSIEEGDAPSLAQLYFRWEELDVLADLVDDKIGGHWGPMPVMDPRWPMLNSLRTALREAQQTVRR